MESRFENYSSVVINLGKSWESLQLASCDSSLEFCVHTSGEICGENCSPDAKQVRVQRRKQGSSIRRHQNVSQFVVFHPLSFDQRAVRVCVAASSCDAVSFVSQWNRDHARVGATGIKTRQ